MKATGRGRCVTRENSSGVIHAHLWSVAYQVVQHCLETWMARRSVDRCKSDAGAVSGVVCQFRIAGSVQFPLVTCIKSLRTPNISGL